MENDQQAIPELLPEWKIRELRTDADAIEESLRQARKLRRGVPAHQIARESGFSAATLTKMRQEQAGFPQGTMQRFIQATGCPATLQRLNRECGYVAKTLSQELADQDELRRLEARVAELREQKNAAYDACIRLDQKLSER